MENLICAASIFHQILLDDEIENYAIDKACRKNE